MSLTPAQKKLADKKKAAAQKKAQAAVAADDELVLLRAAHPIRHDGKDYDEGEVFAADPDSAAQLLASEAAEVAPVDAA